VTAWDGTVPAVAPRRHTVLWVVLGSVAVVTVLAVAAGPLAWRVLTRKSYVVPSAAMEPAIPAGSRIWCTRSAPAKVERGDVVVYVMDVPGQRTFVKRVVGLPGETVASADGSVLTIGGTPLAEPYADTGGRPLPFPAALVPHDAVFLVGDNRDHSADSRLNGPVPLSALRGVCDV
jgi:signal peptidase I